nr:MAG TPA: hypothetical protein [Caudoviricetes sp.]
MIPSAYFSASLYVSKSCGNSFSFLKNTVYIISYVLSGWFSRAAVMRLKPTLR